jgi:plastocyanin
VRHLLIIAAVAVMPLACSSPPAGEKAPAAPRTHHVTIDATSFSPSTLTINVGDSIVWTNKDIVAHSATSQAGGFDSGRMESGATWTYTAKTKGLFPYLCTFHPTMTGELRVQ